MILIMCASHTDCHSNGKGGLNPRPDHTGFEAGNIVIGYIIFRILSYVPVTIILLIPLPLPRVLSYSDLLASEKRLP